MMIRKILSLFFILFSPLFLVAVQTGEYEDVKGRRLIVDRNEEGQTTRLATYSGDDNLLSQIRFFYNDSIYSVKEEHDLIVEGEVKHTFTVAREYDLSQRKVAFLQEGEGMRKQKQFYYLPNGSVEKIVKPDGVVLFFSYDDLERLKEISSSDDSVHYTYMYDKKNRLLLSQDLLRKEQVARTYDASGRLIEEIQGAKSKIGYTYDQASRVTEVLLPDNSTIHYLFDGEEIVGYHRKLKGEKEYRFSKKEAALPQFPLPDLTYGEDGQLAEEKGYRYAHDSLFNRRTQNGEDWKFNGLNQLIEIPNEAFSYDLNGNLIQHRTEKGIFSFHYDAFDQLIEAILPDGTQIFYTYDGLFRRLSKTVVAPDQAPQSYRFFYDGVNEIGVVDASHTIRQLRILDREKKQDIGAILGIELDGRAYIPSLDGQGSVRAMVDLASKKVVEMYTYTAFGLEEFLNADHEKIAHSALKNPWRYLGKRTEEELNFVFFGRRYYAPQIGRWITPDPVYRTDSPNEYAFVKNNPVNWMDPYGLFFIEGLYQNFLTVWDYFKESAENLFKNFQEDVVHYDWKPEMDLAGRYLFGDYYFLMGFHSDKEEKGVRGDKIVNEKVRISFINGLLTSHNTFIEHLDRISATHGGAKVAYLFCPTQGWFNDISRAIYLKGLHHISGYRTPYTYLLAELWREQIEEMGGVGKGGVIIHYAHSLGGTETDRARDLLSPEEQQMIRVVTLGSPTHIRSGGFQSVENHISSNDFIRFLEPFGSFRNFFDKESNLYFHGVFGLTGIPLIDHLFDGKYSGKTYTPLLVEFGERFLSEFGG